MFCFSSKLGLIVDTHRHTSTHIHTNAHDHLTINVPRRNDSNLILLTFRQRFFLRMLLYMASRFALKRYFVLSQSHHHQVLPLWEKAWIFNRNYQFGFFVIVLFCLQYLIICIVRIIIEWTVICRFFDRFIPQLTTLPIRYQKLTLISQQDGCLKSHVTATFLLGSTVTICNTRFRELFFKLTTTFLLTTIGNGYNWKISFSDSFIWKQPAYAQKSSAQT